MEVMHKCDGIVSGSIKGLDSPLAIWKHQLLSERSCSECQRNVAKRYAR